MNISGTEGEGEKGGPYYKKNPGSAPNFSIPKLNTFKIINLSINFT